jgi:hypothetical protein
VQISVRVEERSRKEVTNDGRSTDGSYKAMMQSMERGEEEKEKERRRREGEKKRRREKERKR